MRRSHHEIVNQQKIQISDIDPIALDAIDGFLYMDNTDEDKSPATITDYQRILYHLILEIRKKLVDIRIEDVSTWFNTGYGNKSSATKHKVYSVISCFFRYCLQNGYTLVYPIGRISCGKIPKPQPRHLFKQEMAKVILMAEKLPLRDRALTELLYSTGCRRDEILGIRIKDIDFSDRSILIHGKGDFYRFAFFNETSSFLLKELIKGRNNRDEYVFLNKFNRKLSCRWVNRIISDLGEKARLSKRLTPHRFRHSYGSKLASNGVELRKIAELLGHKNIGNAVIYTHLLSESLINLFRLLRR